MQVYRCVSVLYREPKLLKVGSAHPHVAFDQVSVLYREPKLLKATAPDNPSAPSPEFQCSTVSRNC